MLSVTQILLIFVVSILTVVLAIIGIQVFLILKESRRSIEKVNKMLDDAGRISESIAKPLSALSGSLSGLSGITGILNWIFKKKKEKDEEDQDES